MNNFMQKLNGMNQEIYILSLPGVNKLKMMYVAESGRPTLKLSEAKTFASKHLLQQSSLATKEYRWWDITCITKKTIFEARLTGK